MLGEILTAVGFLMVIKKAGLVRIQLKIILKINQRAKRHKN